MDGGPIDGAVGNTGGTVADDEHTGHAVCTMGQVVITTGHRVGASGHLVAEAGHLVPTTGHLVLSPAGHSVAI